MVDSWNEQFLLATKLTVPQSYARPVVPRPRLYSRLECGLRCPLLLISAPAGFGKTTLLSSWLHEYAHAVAWVSLDGNDNRLVRFWKYCLAAIVRAVHAQGESSDEYLATLEALPLEEPSQVEYALTLLINILTAWGQELILVLDDYQVVTSPAVQQTLAFFLAHLPANAHVVLSTRVDPALPLARWRVQSRLFELRADDLRFSLEEIVLLLHEDIAIQLKPEDIVALKRNTEGWIAGLQLAMLSLQGRPDGAEISRFIEAFGGTNRHVLHYLTEEVLAHLPESVQEFLLTTSILERMNASLCDAVMGQKNSELMLAWLDQENLFLSQSDVQGTWYHYHHLFIDLLRHRLQQQHAELVPTLHGRASLWYEQHHMLVEAIEHALLAADQRRVVELIERYAWSLWQQGRCVLIYDWLTRLQLSPHCSAPIEFEDYPTFTYFSALRAMQAGEEEGYAATLSRIKMEPYRQALAAHEAVLHGDGEQALLYAQQHVALLPPTLPGQGMAHLYRGIALLLCGDTQQAFHELIQGRHLGMRDQQMATQLTAVLYLGHCSYLQGYLSEALSWYQECLGVSDEYVPWLQIEARLRCGYIYLEWDEVERAEEQLECARRLMHGHMHTYIVPDATLLAAQLAWLHNKRNQAHLLLDQAEGEILRQGGHPWQQARIALLRIRYWLAEGCVETAVRWSEHMVSLMSQEGRLKKDGQLLAHEQWSLAHAYIALALQQPGEAVRCLQPLLAQVRKQERRYSELRMLIVLALAYTALNDTRRAKQTLETLLVIAQHDNYRRTLLDEGQPLMSLLGDLYRRQQKRFTGEFQPHILEYMHGLLQRFGYNAIPHDWVTWQKREQGNGIVSNRLSERELEVLKLIAEGNSNQQIARTLVVAESTIKTHLNNIYGKLNVNSRLQALTRAHANGILEL